MGSKVSKTKRPTPVKSKTQTALASKLPQDIIDEILDHLVTRLDSSNPKFRELDIASNLRSLRSCALVSKPWVPSCRRRLFHTIVLTPFTMTKWLEKFPVPEESPAHLVKDLYVWVAKPPDYYVPDKFFEYTPWFANANSLTLLGCKDAAMRQRPLFWRSPRSITSLAIKTSWISLLEIRDIMAELPNLDSLWLSGALDEDGRRFQRIGTILRGRFSGKLRLCYTAAGESVTNMLLEIPTGIHFTEFQIECPRSFIPSNIRFLEACSNTLVRLSYMVDFERKSHSLSWPSWFQGAKY